MSDLNLNFDSGTKNISVLGGNTTEVNPPVTLGFKPENDASSPIKNIDLKSTPSAPNLSTSDPNGMGLLIGKPANELSPKSETQETKNESSGDNFSFFKPSEASDKKGPNDVGGIVNGDLKDVKVNPDEAIFATKERTDEAGYKPIHRLSPQEIKNEKIDLLYKFKKLESQGIRTTMNYNMNSHLEDMRNEYIKLKKQREVDNSVKFQRKMLMACVTGVEFLNGKFDPFSVKLDGWSESVNENLNDYDEIFEELGEKYGGTGNMAPELRLMFTLAGSAFMFHLSNTMFKSSIPGMDDVLRQNPELMKQFAEAAVGSMNGPSQPRMPGPPQMAPQGPPQMSPSIPDPISMMMGGGQKSSVDRTNSPARSDMSGPDGIDELITKMNLEPNKIPDLDTVSLMSGDTDRKSNQGITLNL